MLRQIFEIISRIVTWWVIVSPWQQALRLRLGTHQTELGAGIHLKIPYIHQVYVQNTRLLIVDTPNQTVTTADGRVVTLSLVVGYRITDIKRVFSSIQSPKDAVNSLAMGAVSSYVTSHGSAECSVPALEADLVAQLDAKDWGLEFDLIKITDFAFVKTYRFITNEANNNFWSGSVDLDESARGPSGY